MISFHYYTLSNNYIMHNNGTRYRPILERMHTFFGLRIHCSNFINVFRCKCGRKKEYTLIYLGINKFSEKKSWDRRLFTYRFFFAFSQYHLLFSTKKITNRKVLTEISKSFSLLSILTAANHTWMCLFLSTL